MKFHSDLRAAVYACLWCACLCVSVIRVFACVYACTANILHYYHIQDPITICVRVHVSACVHVLMCASLRACVMPVFACVCA